MIRIEIENKMNTVHSTVGNYSKKHTIELHRFCCFAVENKVA